MLFDQTRIIQPLLSVTEWYYTFPGNPFRGFLLGMESHFFLNLIFSSVIPSSHHPPIISRLFSTEICLIHLKHSITACNIFNSLMLLCHVLRRMVGIPWHIALLRVCAGMEWEDRHPVTFQADCLHLGLPHNMFLHVVH